MTAFEYRFELNVGESEEGMERTEEELNGLGAQGWELVAVTPCGKDNSYLGYWFKRPKDSK
jgi:hypothetical protein